MHVLRGGATEQTGFPGIGAAGDGIDQKALAVKWVVDVWRYPPNWPAISRRIRERDGQRYRWCGASEALFDLDTGRSVLLTTMHLDGDPMNCENWNLVTACRPGHAAYDAPGRLIASAETRRWTRIETGQIELFPDLL